MEKGIDAHCETSHCGSFLECRLFNQISGVELTFVFSEGQRVLIITAALIRYLFYHDNSFTEMYGGHSTKSKPSDK